MKLSVLLPSYRYDCRPLVRALLPMLPAESEILVGDDHSATPESDAYLTEMEGWTGVRVLRKKRNEGSAAMRNTLAREARGEYLLYLDCDGMPLSPDFLSVYLSMLPTDDILCGSVRNAEVLPSPDVRLRWTYERQAERRFTAERRNRRPYQNFRTFNFLVPRSIMLRCPFDETVRLSGYEDTLAGRSLCEAGIRIRHIENPLLNVGLEANETYLAKVERQLATLLEKRQLLSGYSTLLGFYERLERFGLSAPLRLFHRLLAPAERHNLLSSHPRMWVFQLYKLGTFATLCKGEK